MTELPPTGHNNPPSPIDDALAPYGDYIAESEQWLDGTPVETEAQMIAVDALLKEIKAAHKAVNDAKEAEAKPLHDAWKDALARYKPTLDDLDRMKKGLVGCVDAFKRKLAAGKAEAERKAREAAEAKARAAHESAMKAHDTDIEAQRAAADAKREAEIAHKLAAKAGKDTVKGMVTRTFYEVENHRDLLHWIAANRKDDLTAFIEEWARKNHSLGATVPGLRVWQDKVAR